MVSLILPILGSPGLLLLLLLAGLRCSATLLAALALIPPEPTVDASGDLSCPAFLGTAAPSGIACVRSSRRPDAAGYCGVSAALIHCVARTAQAPTRCSSSRPSSLVSPAPPDRRPVQPVQVLQEIILTASLRAGSGHGGGGAEAGCAVTHYDPGRSWRSSHRSWYPGHSHRHPGRWLTWRRRSPAAMLSALLLAAAGPASLQEVRLKARRAAGLLYSGCCASMLTPARWWRRAVQIAMNKVGIHPDPAGS